MLDNYRWQLLAAFEYHVGSYPGEVVIRIPAGYVTDLTSVPRPLWAIYPPHGRYAKAAIVHDYLYSNALVNKAYADKTFYEAMGVLGVRKVTRQLMYFAVLIFGRGAYGQK
ncbi:MAG: DUF1353 domain-containing protein [Sulfuriferula sp.]